MKVDDLRIGQRVQWHRPNIPDIPPARVIGLKEKFSRSPDLRLVDVHLWFDRPLFPNPIIDKTNRLWVDHTELTLIESPVWSGRDEAEAKQVILKEE